MPIDSSSGDSAAGDSLSQVSAGSAAGRDVLRLLLGVAIGSIVAIGVAIVVARQRAGPRAVDLTPEMVDQALARWERADIVDYDLDVRISGTRAGSAQVEVRGGEVVAMTRDGQTPRVRSAWEAWTAPGLFDMIYQDLDSAANPAGPFGAPAGTKVILRALFDEQTGLPRRYQRFVLGTQLGVEWEVTRFERRDGGARVDRVDP